VIGEGGSGTVEATITTAGTGGSVTQSDSIGYSVDTILPSATINLDANIAGDGVVDYGEVLGDVAISGTVGGDVQDGDTVTLVVNGNVSTGTVSGGSFSINVAGSDLLADPDKVIEATVDTYDVAGNHGTASTSETYAVDPTIPVPEITLDAITGDGVINQLEAGDTSLAITGSVAGDAQVGDQVTISINGAQVAVGYVASDMTFSVNVDGSLLAAIGEGGSGTVEATITTAGTGGSVTQSDSIGYSADTILPAPSITVDDITLDNVLNIAEVNNDVAVTGSVLGAQAGDMVTLTVNSVEYSGLVRPDGTFSINVRGSDLLADQQADGVGEMQASITTFDSAGNLGSGGGPQIYDVDIAPPTVNISFDHTPLNVGDSALVTFVFDEAVTGFTNDDLTVTNGDLTDVASLDGGVTWTATFTPDALIEVPDNIITLNNAGVNDLAGNPGTGTTDSAPVVIDTLPAEVTDLSVDDADLNLTDADAWNTLTLTVSFSEAMDTSTMPTLEFSEDLFNVLNPSLLASGGSWDVTGTTFTATYDVLDTGVDFDSVSVGVIGVTDANGNDILDYAPEVEFAVDTVNPTVIISDSNVDGVVSFEDRVVTYTLDFSEPILSFSDLDLTISGGDLTSAPVLAADGLSATFDVTAFDTSNEDLVVTVNDTVVDLNGNALISDINATSTLPVDTLNPRCTITNDNID